MKREYWLIGVAGLLILGYILDAVATPLGQQLTLANPYAFFKLTNLAIYPWTLTSILLKTISLVIGILVVLGVVGFKRLFKAGVLLVVGALLQLYALQDVASRTFRLPLEWSLALTLAGIVLLLPMVIFLLGSMFERSKSDSIPLVDPPPSLD